MYLLLRAIPLLLPLTIVGIFRFLQVQPPWVLDLFGIEELTLSATLYLGGGISLILLAALILIGIGQPFRDCLRFWLLPLLLWWGSFATFLFSEGIVLQGFLAAGTAFSLWLWMESLFLYWQRPDSYQPYTLPRLAQWIYIFSLFLLFAAISGLQTLFQLPLWPALLVVTLVTFIVQYDVYLLNRYDPRESLVITLVGCFLSLQLYVVLNLLPTQFFMYGLIMTLFFYVWFSLARIMLYRQKNRKTIRGPILVSGMGTAIAIVTALFIGYRHL